MELLVLWTKCVSNEKSEGLEKHYCLSYERQEKVLSTIAARNPDWLIQNPHSQICQVLKSLLFSKGLRALLKAACFTLLFMLVKQNQERLLECSHPQSRFVLTKSPKLYLAMFLDFINR